MTAKKIILLFLSLLLLFLTACGDTAAPGTSARTENIGETLPRFTESAPAAPTGETRISFAAAGDNIAHDSVIDTARADAKGGEAYDFTEIYAGIAGLISDADIAFVNQEAPVGGAELGISGYPNFNAPREQVEALIDLGFDVFNVANNHMLDKGAKGYTNTVDYFQSLPVTMIGGYKKTDYDQMRVVECKGVKIAFLGYTEMVNYGHRDDLPASSDYLIPYMDEADLSRQVALAKQAADVVIVSCHFGTEDEFGTTASQERFAKKCADLGVDVLLGHHSHVVGPVEWVSGESGNRTLVAYSLGNLCSTMLYARNMVGQILTFDLVKAENGTVTVENPTVHPVVSHYLCDTSRLDNQDLYVRYASRVYLLRDYTEALTMAHGAQNFGAFTFADLKAFVTDHVDPAFLPAYMQ